MKNIIETSTAAIGHFVYHGTYETYLGEYMYGVSPDMHDEAEEAVGKLAIEIITEVFEDIFPSDLRYDFELAYERTYHPRYYNFETDYVIFLFKYTDALKNWLFNYVENNENFLRFLKDNYTSRSGFISFTPNNWNEWLEGWNDDEWKCVSALLAFVIQDAFMEYEIEDFEYDFNEKASEIISEQYTPWEYAVKFDNDFVAVIRGGYYDEETGYDIFKAWLLDTNGEIVNNVALEDCCYEFNQSAYAAWEYSDIQRDLTEEHTLCSWYCTQCNVPEGFEEVIQEME